MAFGSGTAEPTPSFLSRPAKQRYFCAMASRRVAECSGMRTPQVNRPSMMRRRRLLPHRRRRSIQNLIVGFEQLRSYLPSYLYGHRLTRLETLRLATQYIRDLTNLLLDSEGQFSADCQNTSHASTDRVRSILPGPKSHCTRGNFSSEPLDSGVPLQIDEDECPKLPMHSTQWSPFQAQQTLAPYEFVPEALVPPATVPQRSSSDSDLLFASRRWSDSASSLKSCFDPLSSVFGDAGFNVELPDEMVSRFLGEEEKDEREEGLDALLMPAMNRACLPDFQSRDSAPHGWSSGQQWLTSNCFVSATSS